MAVECGGSEWRTRTSVHGILAIRLLLLVVLLPLVLLLVRLTNRLTTVLGSRHFTTEDSILNPIYFQELASKDRVSPVGQRSKCHTEDEFLGEPVLCSWYPN